MAAEDWIPGDGSYEDGDEEPQKTECKFCGKGGLEWADDNGRWVLIEHNGKIHKCDPTRIARNVSSDFDDIS